MHFSIQKGHGGRERLAIISAAESIGHTYSFEDAPLEGSVPIGTVEWCAPAFGEHHVGFYPGFLRGRLFRAVKALVGSCVLQESLFVKDATAWKSDWKTRLYPAGTLVPEGEWLLSEPIVFKNEWRYYVADGWVVTTGWYAGEDEDKPAPRIDVGWPAGFSGAVDFGELEDGFMALVEAHAPFACGWYGDEHRDYVHWQAQAWKQRAWWHVVR